MRILGFVIAGILILALCPSFAGGDEFVLSNGSKLTGVEVKTQGDTVFINTFNSKNERMTLGVERVPKSAIKRVVAEREPWRDYLLRLADLRRAGASADEECALGRLAKERGLSAAAEERFLAALAIDRGHAEARAALDPKRLAELERSDPRLSSECAAALEGFCALDDAAARRAAHADLVKRFGIRLTLDACERVRRSRARSKGRREDVPLTLNSKVDKGVYTVFVPESYDGWRPVPLVVGLHGGGADGKDRQAVVGSGKSAMNFYQRGADRLGYIVVCPTAIQAPWQARENDTFVLSVLEEICLLYNIDLNRVYLTGHSMGGFGAWYFGPRYAHLWAAIAPMAGGGHGGLARLAETMTPVYLYHGADDAVVGCADSRAAADALRRGGHDFAYTELPDSGHGFPDEIAGEMWSFFEARRLAATPKRSDSGKFAVTLEPYSSFARPASAAEREYFGTPGAEVLDDKKGLLARMKLGGGAAEEAAAGLVKLADKTTVAPLAVLATAKTAANDIRLSAVRALGDLGFAEAVPSLTRLLADESLDLVREAAAALGKIGDRKAVAPLIKALPKLHAAFDGRLTNKVAMHFSDWRSCHEAFAAVAEALGRLGDAAAVEPLAASAERLLLATWQPERSQRAGLDPDLPLGRCTVTFIEALGALGDRRALPMLEKLAARHAALAGVTDAADAARGKIRT